MKQSKKKESVGSRIGARLKGFAEALKREERISERFVVKRMELNLEPTVYEATSVQKTRKLLEMSQSVFAKFLGVSVNTVRAWEQGINTPSGMACRFMDELRHDPVHWRERIKQMTVETTEP